MSSDSPSEKNNPPKLSPASHIEPKEETEIDLWDLDATDEDAPEESSELAKENSVIPTRHIRESPIQSSKPMERQISNPTLDEGFRIHAEPRKKTPGTTTSNKIVNKEDFAKPATEDATVEDKESDHLTEPVSVRPPFASFSTILKSLSKAEKIGSISLLVILAIGAIFTVVHFSNRLETRSMLSEKLELPIEGKLIKVTAVSTYWREPVTIGQNPDTVKRGTKLIPVLKIKLEAKSAAIRVLFRNEVGGVIGDPINRSVNGKTELTIPSTAGFDDVGMHTAYRTGESEPWIIQVLEAADSGASIDKFKTLLETEISTDIR